MMKRTTWTVKGILQYAERCSTLKEFRESYPNAYVAAHRYKLMDVIRNRLTSPEKYTDKGLVDLIHQYQYRDQFVRNHPKAYDAAKRRGIWKLHKLPSRYRHNWTKTEILNSAQNYESRTEWQKSKDSAIYQATYKLGILEEACKHMQPPPISWTIDRIERESKKYNTKMEFFKGSQSAFRAAYKSGVLETVCSHMTVLRKSWDREEVIEALSHYKTRTAAVRGNVTAYHAAHRMGLLDEACEHMQYDKHWSDNDVVYIWEAKKIDDMHLIKIGLTSLKLGDERIVKVAKSLDVVPVILAMVQVDNAYQSEQILLEHGKLPDLGYTGDGKTEFRLVSTQELQTIIDLAKGMGIFFKGIDNLY